MSTVRQELHELSGKTRVRLGVVGAALVLAASGLSWLWTRAEAEAERKQQEAVKAAVAETVNAAAIAAQQKELKELRDELVAQKTKAEAAEKRISAIEGSLIRMETVLKIVMEDTKDVKQAVVRK